MNIKIDLTKDPRIAAAHNELAETLAAAEAAGLPVREILAEGRESVPVPLSAAIDDGKVYRPFYNYISDCFAEGEVFPTRRHYLRHEPDDVCDRAEQEAALFDRFVTDEDFVIDGWNPYRGKKKIADLPHLNYEIGFPEDGGIYHGITYKPLTYRVFGHIHYSDLDRPVGGRIRNGWPYTAKVVHHASTRAEAQLVERARIIAGNPNGPVLNDRHNPWRRQPTPRS